MAAREPAGGDGFFFEPVESSRAALSLARAIIERGARCPAGVAILVSETPLAVELSSLSPERLLSVIPQEQLPLAAGILDFMLALGREVRHGVYGLDELVEEFARLSLFTSSSAEPWAELQALRGKGCRFADVPPDAREAQDALLQLSREADISLEYLLGNLLKAARLLKRLGVRDVTLNASSLFHNFESGFVEGTWSATAAPASAEILGRACSLEQRGTTFRVFRRGDFNKKMSDLSGDDLDAVIAETEAAYQVGDGEFRRFIGALLDAEQERLDSAPPLALVELLRCFKFSQGDREAVALPAVVEQDDPTRWQETDLGAALTGLKPDLNWLAVSVGVKAAGNIAALRKSEEIRARAEEIQRLAGGLSITLLSGRNGGRRENRIRDLSADELIFDLYCLAVLEQRGLGEVLTSAGGLLRLIRSLESPEPIVNLNEAVAARLAGESYASLLGTQGLVLRSSPLTEALSRLRALGGRVRLTVKTEEGTAIPVEEVDRDDFRKAVILMGRRFQVPHSPERVLATISDKIVPEITRLPAAVIAGGAHDLGRIVELAIGGIPARYPLRRPWKRINLDPLTCMGSGLEPGIRNCLGCPVNSLYGLVMKAAWSQAFEEVITYEATGCFEVYSGIWPYTGKKHPSLHGVFGGVPSEMLGGLAAKKARLKHALKASGGSGAAHHAKAKRVLHLGWGGDGSSFDIGFGNLSGLFSRLQKLSADELDARLQQRALYVCYDNEGYQNTGNQYSAASAPGGNTTTYPQGKHRPMGSDLKKKPIVEIMAEHGVSVSARMNIHRAEHIVRVVGRALEDGDKGGFIHFLQPCTTGWKFAADNLTYDLSYLSEEGGLFPPVTIEHGVPYLEVYPTPRNPGDAFLTLQARFKHLVGNGPLGRKHLELVMEYYRDEWTRNLYLTGFEGEIPRADRYGYLEDEHRKPRINV
jgi:pyruvate ferredoxin oxidoreductase beta subunit